ncbi:hypothetical protein ACU4I5_05750 [Ensifer adhaerens]
MSDGGFFGGFAEGFSRSMERRRLRDVLQFQREQQTSQDRRADRQLQLQERGLDLREQESQGLQDYRRQAMENQRQLLEIQKRNASIDQEMKLRQMDSAVLSGLEKVFDPRIPSPMRSLILKQSAPQLGIDPKSDQFKAFADTVTKLDSDSLSALSKAVQLMVPSASPGDVTALAKGVLSGQMTIAQVMDMAKAQAQALREDRERQLLERELGGGAASDQQSPSSEAPPPTSTQLPQGRTQGSGGIASTSVDLSSRQPSDPGLNVPGFETLPPAKQNAVRRDMLKAIPDIETTPTEQMTPDKLRKSAAVFMKHNMKEAANFARLLAQDLENAGAGTFLSVDPKSGQVVFSQGGKGGQTKPFTEQQSKDLVFATRAKGALKNLDPIDEKLTSIAGRAAEMDPTGLARLTQSPDFQKAAQAGLEFLQAILRKDTGAAITKEETGQYGQTYLPQVGDKPEVLVQKREARRRAIIALESGMTREQILRLEQSERAETSSQPETAVRPSTKADYDKLPSGTLYIHPNDGQTYRKP